LADRRGQDLRVTSRKRPLRVDAVLAGVLEKHGVRKQVERIGVLELWPEIVGEKLARVTRVKGLDEDALFVEVPSSAWLMELSMMKGDFLERVNARLGDAPIDRIVFVLAETS
jgi:predicted nucleic acid-binding Zn ribbon protein